MKKKNHWSNKDSEEGKKHLEACARHEAWLDAIEKSEEVRKELETTLLSHGVHEDDLDWAVDQVVYKKINLDPPPRKKPKKTSVTKTVAYIDDSTYFCL